MIQADAPGERAAERLDLPYRAAGKTHVLGMIEAVDALVSDESGERVRSWDKSANPSPVALLGLLPERVGFGEQPAGIQSADLDRQPLGKDMMGDQLIFDAEAGGEDDASIDGVHNRMQPISDALSG